ncbi:HAUS1 protein, partial [Campylorhamphus procurvoides]|nr:HAUS1 protein [Campylorhamphus procurvoides]
QVTLWLKKIYGDWPIPTYEVNERTVDILHGLMELNEARDRDISLVIEEMKDQEARYDAETKEMQDILQHDLGLSIYSLSRKARKCHKDLVKSAMAVDAKDTSLTSFFCAINDMTWELYDTEYKNRIMARKVNTLKKKMAAVLAMEKRVQEDIKKVEEQQKAERIKIESRSRNLKFLRDKTLELNIRIRNAQEELISRGMDRSLTHDALVQLYQEVVPLQEKVASLKKELKNFYDLPPVI